jgi:hypothetical protein
MKKKHGCLIALLAFPIWIAVWMLVFSLSDPRLPANDGSRVDLSGVYRIAQTTEHYGMGNPILSVGMIADDSDISIRHTPDDELTVESKWKNGRTDLRSVHLTDRPFSWHDGELRYVKCRSIFGGILPGAGRQCRSTTVKQDAEGTVTVASEFQEKAVMLFIIPFWESHRYSVTLKRKEQEDQNNLLHRTDGCRLDAAPIVP